MPRTEAGKRLLATSKNLPVHTAEGWTHLGMRDAYFLYQPAVDAVLTEDAIDAIEAEAFAAGDRQGFDAGEVAGLIHERARIRAAVAKYIAHHSHEPGRNCVSAFCAAGLHSAVLAIIDEEDTDA